MAATFPGSVYSPRTKENKAGVVYDADKKTLIFAEDVVKLDEEIVAIETFLLDKEKIVAIPTESFKVPALKPATFAEYGVGSALEYADTKEEIAFSKIHVPYDLDPATQPKIVLEWSTEATELNCKWKIEYLWRGLNEAINAAADDTITDVYESSAVAFGLNHTEIPLANLASTDHFLIVRITRLGDEVEDTLGKNAFLTGISLEYISNALGKTP